VSKSDRDSIRAEQEREPKMDEKCNGCKWNLGGVCHYDGDSCAKDVEIKRFKKLVKGHEKLLMAIGKM
jgi:hypothetical protein